MSKKVIVNGDEVVPAKKVKLFEKMPRKKIDDLIRKKQKEVKQQNAKIPKD
jgi:hypothetical protein